jgi:DNA-binding IclR family transcriptional regulator
MMTKTEARAENTEEVRVLARGLEILRAFAPRNTWMSNQQLAESVQLPKPTISRLTSNLTKMGYLEYSQELGRYRLGASVLALGFAARSSLGIQRLAHALMQQLADREDTTVVLATREGLTMFCHEVSHGRHMVALRVNPGSRLVLPYSAMGRALIGALDNAERADLLAEVKEKFARNWPQLRADLDDAVMQMREKDFCTTIGTLESGVNGVATVIDWPAATQRYVIGCAGPATRHSKERLERDFGPALLAIKRNLEGQLAPGMHSAIEVTA